MAPISHEVELACRGPSKPPPTITMDDSSSLPQLLPPELLLKTATFIDLAEDLQNLRLVDRAFSKAATTALQDRYYRVYLLPTRPSMDRFSKLTRNKLVAFGITEIVVLYTPPYAPVVLPPACQAIAAHHDMPWQTVTDIVSEYNDMCVVPVDATDADAPLRELNVVESGELARVLGEGIQRLDLLHTVSFRSDLDMPTEAWFPPCLNVPRFREHCLFDFPGGKFDVIQHLTVGEYARYEMLRYMHTTCLGRGSPTYLLGALRHWFPGTEGDQSRLKFLVTNMGSPYEAHWLKGLASCPRLIEDGLINITKISLTFNGCPPPPWLAAQFDNSGEEFTDLALAPHWCTLLQAAANLQVLRLADVSTWSIGFNSLLHHIFQSFTWSKLAHLSIVRTKNIKLLPVQPHNTGYCLSWYLFLQSDLDKFLLRHRTCLELLDLHNVVGLDQQVSALPLSLQYQGEGFPEDPTPSLEALENSLRM